MTNYNERLDKILGIFSGGITAKGSDRGGYPTYFTEPYPIWCEVRKNKAKQAILDWHNKQVEEVLIGFAKEADTEYYRSEIDEWLFSLGLIVHKAIIEAERNRREESK